MKEATNNSDNPAKRLLAKLKSPLLFIGSELLNPQNPHTPFSRVPGNDKSMEADFSGGRLAPFSSQKNEPNSNCRNSLMRQIDLFRHRKLAAERKLPSRWYQQRKEAVKEIREITNGKLELSPYQFYYHGHDRSHQVICKACNESFRLALTELRLEGPNICPFRHGGLLSRIGSHDRINKYLSAISDGKIMMIKNQFLGCTDYPHTIYHLACRQTFEANFDYVTKQCLEGVISDGCTHREHTKHL